MSHIDRLSLSNSTLPEASLIFLLLLQALVSGLLPSQVPGTCKSQSARADLSLQC